MALSSDVRLVTAVQQPVQDGGDDDRHHLQPWSNPPPARVEEVRGSGSPVRQNSPAKTSLPFLEAPDSPQEV